MRRILVLIILVSNFAYPYRAQAQKKSPSLNSILDAYIDGLKERQAQEQRDLENKQKADALAQEKYQFDRQLELKQKEFEAKQQNQKFANGSDTNKNVTNYGTANELMNGCAASIAIAESRLVGDTSATIQGIAEANRCSGYVSALIDMNDFAGNTLFCAPKQASIEQFTRVFVKYMSEHPEGDGPISESKAGQVFCGDATSHAPKNVGKALAESIVVEFKNRQNAR